MSTSPIQFYFWVSWDDFEWTDKNSHLRPNNLTGVRKSQTIKDERGMCECGNFKNPLQTVVLFLLTLVIWSCSVSWLLSSGLLDLSPSHIPETIFTCSLDLLSKLFLNSASLTMAEIPKCSHISTPFIPVAHRWHFLATLSFFARFLFSTGFFCRLQVVRQTWKMEYLLQWEAKTKTSHLSVSIDKLY